MHLYIHDSKIWILTTLISAVNAEEQLANLVRYNIMTDMLIDEQLINPDTPQLHRSKIRFFPKERIMAQKIDQLDCEFVVTLNLFFVPFFCCTNPFLWFFSTVPLGIISQNKFSQKTGIPACFCEDSYFDKNDL